MSILKCQHHWKGAQIDQTFFFKVICFFAEKSAKATSELPQPFCTAGLQVQLALITVTQWVIRETWLKVHCGILQKISLMLTVKHVARQSIISSTAWAKGQSTTYQISDITEIRHYHFFSRVDAATSVLNNVIYKITSVQRIPGGPVWHLRLKSTKWFHRQGAKSSPAFRLLWRQRSLGEGESIHTGTVSVTFIGTACLNGVITPWEVRLGMV